MEDDVEFEEFDVEDDELLNDDSEGDESMREVRLFTSQFLRPY